MKKQLWGILLMLLLGVCEIYAQNAAIGIKGGSYLYRWGIEEIDERYSPAQPNIGIELALGLNEFLEVRTYLGYSQRSLKVNEIVNGPASNDPLLWRQTKNIDLSLGLKSNIIFDAQSPIPLFLDVGIMGSYVLRENREQGFLALVNGEIEELYTLSLNTGKGNPLIELGGYGGISYRINMGDGLLLEVGGLYYYGFTSIKETVEDEFTLNFHRGLGGSIAVLFMLN